MIGRRAWAPLLLVYALCHAEEAPPAAKDPGPIPSPSPMDQLVLRPVPPTVTACERERHPGLGTGPIAVGFYESDFATGWRACPRTELRLGARAGLILDTPNFYGAIGLEAFVAGSWAFGRRGELFATLPLVQYQFVQNATLQGTALGLGDATVGGALVALHRDRLVLTPYLRLLLPTSTLAPEVHTVGGELGLALGYRPSERLAIHAVVAGDLSASLSAGAAFPRGGALVDVGLQYSPATWFALVVAAGAHLGHAAALDWLAPALALRFRLLRNLGAELAATLPLVGADRHDAAAALRLGYRFR